jgi:protein-S-isoprenylcysteine O-methyltransferase Ste14
LSSLLPRAILAFLLLPGTVAFLIPLALLAPGSRGFAYRWGLLPLGIGIALLLACVREFYVAGRGTLAPWAPPVRLVVTGPYRVSRNPMYAAVLLILAGWALGFASRGLTIYAICFAIGFHLRVVFVEEPFLARTQGDAWTVYRRRVPRWLPLPRSRRHPDRP